LAGGYIEGRRVPLFGAGERLLHLRGLLRVLRKKNKGKAAQPFYYGGKLARGGILFSSERSGHFQYQFAVKVCTGGPGKLRFFALFRRRSRRRATTSFLDLLTIIVSKDTNFNRILLPSDSGRRV